MPKSGCTSFKNWIHWIDYGAYLDDPMVIHNRQGELLTLYHADPNAFQSRLSDFTFTFVRHPLRRSYATFNDKIVLSKGEYFRRAKAEFASRYGVTFGVRRSLFGLIRRRPDRSRRWYQKTFLKFLHYVEDTKEGRSEFGYDWHWSEQVHVLDDARKVRNPDFVGKLENFTEDFAVVAEHAGVGAGTLRRLNEGDRTAPSYDSIVNDEIREVGARVYARDLEMFGYKP